MMFYWGEPQIARLRVMWAKGYSCADIGRELGATKNAIVGKARRLGLRRDPDNPSPKRKPRISEDERAEREQDRRDLDILSDLLDGHGEHSTAHHWGVSQRHVRSLRKAWIEAA